MVSAVRKAGFVVLSVEIRLWDGLGEIWGWSSCLKNISDGNTYFHVGQTMVCLVPRSHKSVGREINAWHVKAMHILHIMV